MALLTPAPPASRTGYCPHLGIPEDAQTSLGYPSPWNLCYHARPAAAVSLEQQRAHCLSPGYARCPVFQSERKERLPRHFRLARPLARWKVAALVLALLLAALGLWAAWGALAGGVFAPLEALPFVQT